MGPPVRGGIGSPARVAIVVIVAGLAAASYSSSSNDDPCCNGQVHAGNRRRRIRKTRGGGLDVGYHQTLLRVGPVVMVSAVGHGLASISET